MDKIQLVLNREVRIVAENTFFCAISCHIVQLYKGDNLNIRGA